MNTGAGADSLTVNGGSATASTTRFQGAVGVSLRADNDSRTLGAAGKVRFNTPAMFGVVVNGGPGTNTRYVTAANVSGHLPSLRNIV